jgi:hypothetical protein
VRASGVVNGKARLGARFAPATTPKPPRGFPPPDPGGIFFTPPFQESLHA